MVLFQDIAEHLTTIHLSRCERGKRCLYEGSTPPGGFPNTWVIKSLIPAIKTICDATFSKRFNLCISSYYDDCLKLCMMLLL